MLIDLANDRYTDVCAQWPSMFWYDSVWLKVCVCNSISCFRPCSTVTHCWRDNDVCERFGRYRIRFGRATIATCDKKFWFDLWRIAHAWKFVALLLGGIRTADYAFNRLLCVWLLSFVCASFTIFLVKLSCVDFEKPCSCSTSNSRFSWPNILRARQPYWFYY